MTRHHFDRLVTTSIISIAIGFLLIFCSTSWGSGIGEFDSDLKINSYITNFLVAGGIIASFGLLIAAYLLIQFSTAPEKEEDE
ncbi:hypothetical protein [Jeotgalibacillus campisalis]|uniref:Uncharacterized protein n=1 Tax=Jeotgalibacillus campisalis TaxID=220754 RepID=A0A0C2RL95_9BACL|nr:hypothetical protein [Jeotgalibacillus campisalis]KIL50995.1 hypothetical protein KR50_08760 [Jeotgalibacillus campisalis]